jgi:hypothetical protein
MRLARKMMGRNTDSGGSGRTEERIFRQLFCCGLKVVISLWSLLMENNTIAGVDVQHLLWALLFLKIYSNEATISGGVDEKTFSKWIWAMIYSTSCLEFLVVSVCLTITQQQK